jgi:hypothetical protein
MIYKIHSTDINGNTIYARIDEDGLIRLTCSAEYPEFQDWIAEGNEPLPAD